MRIKIKIDEIVVQTMTDQAKDIFIRTDTVHYEEADGTITVPADQAYNALFQLCRVYDVELV